MWATTVSLPSISNLRGPVFPNNPLVASNRPSLNLRASFFDYPLASRLMVRSKFTSLFLSFHSIFLISHFEFSPQFVVFAVISVFLFLLLGFSCFLPFIFSFIGCCHGFALLMFFMLFLCLWFTFQGFFLLKVYAVVCLITLIRLV